MNSKRLQLFAEIIDVNARVIDVGTDHAYLTILLYQKGVRKLLASDIHEKALNQAKKSLTAYDLDDKIPVMLSDGLTQIDTKEYDTLVLAGMGFTTISHILSSKEKLASIQTIYLQSNNDHYLLRKFMNQNHWILKNEYILEEKNQVYHIMKYIRGEEQLTDLELLYGKYQKEYQSFYQREYDSFKRILNQIPETHIREREKIQQNMSYLETYL